MTNSINICKKVAETSTEFEKNNSDLKRVKILSQDGPTEYIKKTINKMNDKEFNIYSILLTKDGEILKEQSEKGSIKDAVELGKRIGKLFEDYV